MYQHESNIWAFKLTMIGDTQRSVVNTKTTTLFCELVA